MDFMKKPPMGGKPPFDGPPPPMPDADISAYTNNRLDVPYGSAHPRQIFDIYYPEGEGPFPVLLHLHGGGFAMGHKRDYQIQELLKCTDRGIAFASCNYRRSGEAPFPAAVLDCRLFVDYLHTHTEELNIDDSKMCAFGGSAGANLSAILSMNIEKFYGEERSVNAAVACAVDWFGPTDFSVMDEQARANGFSLTDHDEPQSPESRYIGAPLPVADKEKLAASNPITNISDKMCPILIQHGTKDVLVPYAQSEIFVKAIEEKLGKDKVTFLPLEGEGHDGPGFKSRENMAILFAFLDKHLKGIEPDIPLEEMPLPKCDNAGAANAHFGLGDNLPPMGGPMFDGPPPPGFEPPPLAQEILDSIKEKYLDIAYCEASPSQKLDLYLPENRSGKRPVIIHFHGGAFMMCTKRDDSVEPMLQGLKRGYAVVSAEYRKSGEAIYPAMVHDAKAVIRWVRANAEKYGFDTERIAVWGPSSGGWLSSYIAVTNDDPAFEDLSMGNGEYSSRVHACVDWCGPCGGFLEMDKAFRLSGAGVADHDEANSPESLFLGAKITEIPELCRIANPMTYVSESTVPFFILHGGNDQIVPVEQSLSFAEAINAAAGEGRAILHIAEGMPHHGHPWYHEKWVSDMCLDFLDKVL